MQLLLVQQLQRLALYLLLNLSPAVGTRMTYTAPDGNRSFTLCICAKYVYFHDLLKLNK